MDTTSLKQKKMIQAQLGIKNMSQLLTKDMIELLKQWELE